MACGPPSPLSSGSGGADLPGLDASEAFLPPNYSAPPGVSGAPPSREAAPVQDSYLVDSASSHMLVSKIKPCMSKYKQSYCETANGSLNQLSFI